MAWSLTSGACRSRCKGVTGAWYLFWILLPLLQEGHGRLENVGTLSKEDLQLLHSDNGVEFINDELDGTGKVMEDGRESSEHNNRGTGAICVHPEQRSVIVRV